ncbi:MAG: hypothetical protein ABSF95_06010 [Verrucomicrobiota bacterium]|jgi:hypothetical protein
MRNRFRLYRRKKGGRYYIHDDVTGKQESLGTTDRAAAVRLLHSRNEAEQQPAENLQIARAHLAASDPQLGIRTSGVRSAALVPVGFSGRCLDRKRDRQCWEREEERRKWG